MNPPLDMNKDDFRRFGHELIDWIADYFERIDDLPVLAAIEPGDLKAQLPNAPPKHGEPMEQIIADVDRLIVPALTHWSHPSFFAYFATSTSAPGIFGGTGRQRAPQPNNPVEPAGPVLRVHGRSGAVIGILRRFDG